MNLLKSRIEKIKGALRARDLNQAATLLIHTIASDEIFTYWTDCCDGSERVPKLLKYIHEISFDEALPTASVDLIRGDLKIGVEFFLDHIIGPEDVLFILIHERNHLILRRLYPDVMPGADYPSEVFNFAEDAYVNAIGRRQVASTLPERFYRQPGELLLTCKHSYIDWTLFHINGHGNHNYLKQAHAALYRLNPTLLSVLGEVVVETGGFSGYRRWMELVAEWYQEKKDEEAQTGASGAAGEAEERSAPEPPPATRKEAAEKELEEMAKDPAGLEDEPQGHSEALTQDEGSDDGREPDKEEPPSAVDATIPEPESQEPGNGESAEAGETVARDESFSAIAEVIKTYAPLVQGTSTPETIGSEGSEGGSGVRRIPIPDLRPGDPVFTFIWETSDLSEFRHRVRLFEPGALEGIEGVIQGVLADRATEKTLEGYSIPVPLSITRKDLFSLAGGVIPVVWERRWGVERPYIDLYIDVSGSMNHYYGYIPYIYDALRAVRGRVFQFSTRVVEVDPDDLFLHTTGGTRFDAVAQHLLGERTRAAIIVSDGHGILGSRYVDALQSQLETLVYIKVQENRDRNWELVATEVVVLAWSDDPEG